MDRMSLVLASFPLQPMFTPGFIQGLGNGDIYDLFWYNNAGAAGAQLYPHGMSKYFDLYSWPGWFYYLFAYTWDWFCFLLSPFTFFIPLNIWIGIFNGFSWEGIWKIIIPPVLSWYFGIKGERDWPLF